MWSEILLVINAIVDIVLVGGYITYKRSSNVTSWEAGCSKVSKVLIDWVQEEATGKPPADKILNPDLILSKEEVRELQKRFENNPYIEPFIFVQNCRDVSWYDLTALGLAEKYKSLSREELGCMCHRIISLYFYETRGWIPDIYIFIASPVRLYFAVALSKEASRRLAEQQERYVREEELKASAPNILEEEIDLWEDEKEQDNEARI